MVTVVPLFSPALVASIVPPLALTNALAIQNPRPEPGVCRAFVLDNAGRLAPLARQLDATLPQPVPGYRA